MNYSQKYIATLKLNQSKLVARLVRVSVSRLRRVEKSQIRSPVVPVAFMDDIYLTFRARSLFQAIIPPNMIVLVVQGNRYNK